MVSREVFMIPLRVIFTDFFCMLLFQQGHRPPREGEGERVWKMIIFYIIN